MSYLISLIRLVLPILSGWIVARTFSPSMAIGLALVCSLAMPTFGAMLLASSKVDQVTWKNHLAGWLIPWGYILGKGKLSAISVISGVVWCLLFGLGVFIDQLPTDSTGDNQSYFARTTIQLLLALSWLIDGAALFLLLGQWAQSSNPSFRLGSSLFRLIAFLGILLTVSGTCWALHRPVIALLIAGIPPLLAGTIFGAWAILLITIGRNARWN